MLTCNCSLIFSNKFLLLHTLFQFCLITFCSSLNVQEHNQNLHLLLVIFSIKLWTPSLPFSTMLACGTWDNPELSMFSWWLDLPVTSVCLPAVSYEWGEFSLEEAYWKRVCILLGYICVKSCPPPPTPMQ